ncbi:MAG: type IX secretion system membrane protein PorP/SprF [Bacteroidota bacterium]|nr:type IX secretion system membrane protein PorP/SprF [Bacteroidota bacterium]
MRKTYFLILCFIAQDSLAQGRFSQFYSMPLLFNPANTGRFNKSYRMAGGFRNEVNAVSSFKQSAISIESKILNSIVPENDCLAMSIVGIDEKSLGEGTKNDYFGVSLAYQKGLDPEGEQQIGVGFQFIRGRKRIDPPTYVFEDQLNAWIQSGFTNINIFQSTPIDVSYNDLNAGIVYQGKINTKNFISVSTTLYHANKPHKSFSGGELILDRQFGGHIGWENRPSERNKVYSFLLVNFLENQETILGGAIYQSTISTKRYEIEFGGSFKTNPILGQFIIPMIGLNFREFLLNMSYDINISAKNTQRRGATEITLTYTNATTRSRFLENKFIRY